MAHLSFEDEIVLDFLWPTGGNNGRTYEGHRQYLDLASNSVSNIDINQDIERPDPQGGILDAGKFDEADGGAAVFAGHDGVAIVHALGTDEDKIFGHSLEIVAYDSRGYDSQNRFAHRLYSTFYGHLEEVFVKSGERIKLGQLIGKVGGSGKARIDEYLPHIHFEFQNSEGAAVSVNSPLPLPANRGRADPVRFYKGMLNAPAAQRLSASTLLYGPQVPIDEPRASVTIAAVRPNERLPINLKGFDWAEEVRVRITDRHGSETWPYRDINGEVQSTVTTSAENDDDIWEDVPDYIGGPDLSPVFENPGLYFVQALEQNRDVGWGTQTDRSGISHGDDVPAGESRTVQFGTWNQRVRWAQVDWAQAPESFPRGPEADAINLAVIVSPFAPPTNIEQITERDRSEGNPWRIQSDKTLIVTGTDAEDSIALTLSGQSNWKLTFNDQTYDIADGEFLSVFVDAGEGDDTVSLRELPAAIGAAVFGRGGDDSLYGGDATDFLVGGPGSDFLVGGAGEDWIFGSEGDDVLKGHLDDQLAAAAVDHLFGETGVDELHLDANDDASGGTGLGWQHPINRFDVTNDGQVVSLDVLAVINELNAPDYCRTGESLPRQRPLGAFYYDSNGDGFCTAVGDVLPLINFLNDRADAGEGEFAIDVPSRSNYSSPYWENPAAKNAQSRIRRAAADSGAMIISQALPSRTEQIDWKSHNGGLCHDVEETSAADFVADLVTLRSRF